MPLVEAASLEEDDDLQDRWAALLANAAAGVLDVPPSFTNVLRDLDPAAARVLDFVYRSTMGVALDIQHRVKIDMTGPHVALGMSKTSMQFDLDNMIRLGVLRRPNDVTDDGLYDSIQLTAFGRFFVKACQPPGALDPPVLYADLDTFRAAVNLRMQHEAEQRKAASEQSGPHDSEAD